MEVENIFNLKHIMLYPDYIYSDHFYERINVVYIFNRRLQTTVTAVLLDEMNNKIT